MRGLTTTLTLLYIASIAWSGGAKQSYQDKYYDVGRQTKLPGSLPRLRAKRVPGDITEVKT